MAATRARRVVDEGRRPGELMWPPVGHVIRPRGREVPAAVPHWYSNWLLRDPSAATNAAATPRPFAFALNKVGATSYRKLS